MPITRSQAKHGGSRTDAAGTPRNYAKLAANAPVLDNPSESRPTAKSTRGKHRGAVAALATSGSKNKTREEIPLADGEEPTASCIVEQVRQENALSVHAMEMPTTTMRAEPPQTVVTVRKSFVMPPVISNVRKRRTMRVLSEVVLDDEPAREPVTNNKFLVNQEAGGGGSPHQSNGIVASLEAYSLLQFTKMTANANRIEAKFHRMLQELSKAIPQALRESSVIVLPKTPSKHHALVAKRALTKTPGDNCDGNAASSPALSKLQRGGTSDNTALVRLNQQLFRVSRSSELD